jgi:Uma2 family endonuclease
MMNRDTVPNTTNSAMDTRLKPPQDINMHDLPVIASDLPVIYEDEGQDEMGETDPHYESTAILRYGLMAHLSEHAQYRVFSDLNLYYHPRDPNAYVSPDDMVVAPARDLGQHVTSYRLQVDGPAPVLTAEVLSRRSFQQQDTTNKPQIYADMGVAEYVLVDVTGQFLPQRLLLKRLQPNGDWLDEQDEDGGITSNLGFRIVIEADNRLRVSNAQTGERYARPDEGEIHRQARERVEQQLDAMRAELEELRGKHPDS